ncbi:hypothetical protein ABIC30_006259 [Methylobacterium sp. 1030]
MMPVISMYERASPQMSPERNRAPGAAIGDAARERGPGSNPVEAGREGSAASTAPSADPDASDRMCDTSAPELKRLRAGSFGTSAYQAHANRAPGTAQK